MPPRQHDYDDSGVQVESETTSLLGGKSGQHDSTKKGSSPPSSSRSTIRTTAALALAMLVQSFLLVGVFPYSGFLAMHLVPSLNEENAGRYAGLIASSFMVGCTLTLFIWGKAADRYGRTFTIKATLLLSAVFSVLFGLAPTLPLALMARFALGLSNGLIGSIKTIITEMSHGDKNMETRTMAIVMGMWGYGFLINPAISGYLADPVRQYPDSNFVESLDSFLNLTANPFLLPNLFGCFFCLLAYFFVSAFVDETLPADKIEPFQWRHFVPSFCKRTAAPEGATSIRAEVMEANAEENPATRGGDMAQQYGSDGKQCGNGGDDTLPRWVSPSPSTMALTILSPRSSTAKAKQTPKVEGVQVSSQTKGSRDEEKEVATIKSLWGRQSTRKHLLLYWIYSFLIITVDDTFPLYCICMFAM